MPDVWCQTPACQDAAFLQSADFSVQSCSRAYIQLSFPVWDLGLQQAHGRRSHNATLFTAIVCTAG